MKGIVTLPLYGDRHVHVVASAIRAIQSLAGDATAPARVFIGGACFDSPMPADEILRRIQLAETDRRTS